MNTDREEVIRMDDGMAGRVSGLYFVTVPMEEQLKMFRERFEKMGYIKVAPADSLNFGEAKDIRVEGNNIAVLTKKGHKSLVVPVWSLSRFNPTTQEIHIDFEVYPLDKGIYGMDPVDHI